MLIRFACPLCEQTAQAPAGTDWQCPACDHRLTLAGHPGDQAPGRCLVCGNHELYKKKDFPHALGMAILVAGFLGSCVTHALWEKWLTWTILLGSAALDGLLYTLVGDVVVCYRCDAHFRKVKPAAGHNPFELEVGERYRQERIRRAHLGGQSSPRG